MSELKNLTVASARPLPVILLVDVSGSMEANGKIVTVNRAISEMLESFQEEENSRVEIQVAIITFGGKTATLFQELRPASEIKYTGMKAGGKTPLGAAFKMVTDLIEDRQKIPSRAYAPTIVLVSDGIPTDEWEIPLKTMLSSERASKAARFAISIGDDANQETLKLFLSGSDNKLRFAHEAAEIQKFFRWVTMSVTTRSQSNNPNRIESTEPNDFDY